MNYTFWEWDRVRAGISIEPTAAAPGQPDCPRVSRSDHSAGSKESAPWRALGIRSDWHGRWGLGGGRKKGKKQVEEAARTNRRRTKKRMAAERTARRDKYRHWRKKKFFVHFWEWERARAGIEPTAAAASQPDCPGVGRSDHSACSKELINRLRDEHQGYVWTDTSVLIPSRCSFSCHSLLCPTPVRPGCLFRLFLSLLSSSSQPPPTVSVWT